MDLQLGPMKELYFRATDRTPGMPDQIKTWRLNDLKQLDDVNGPGINNHVRRRLKQGLKVELPMNTGRTYIYEILTELPTPPIHVSPSENSWFHRPFMDFWGKYGLHDR